MCMQKTYIMNDEDIIFERFIEKASEIEISRFADNKCGWCQGRGLYENVLDDKSGYSELCVCDCIFLKEKEMREYIGVKNER